MPMGVMHGLAEGYWGNQLKNEVLAKCIMHSTTLYTNLLYTSKSLFQIKSVISRYVCLSWSTILVKKLIMDTRVTFKGGETGYKE